MIARISGRLEEVRDGLAVVSTGNGLWYEVLLPACDAPPLGARVGQDVTLHTIHCIEGDPARGAVTPRLIGFRTESDRQFFHVYTTVKGIGMRKALRSLARPIGEIAAAIQTGDVRLLKALPEIGPRMAERLVTELAGRVDGYAIATAPGGRAMQADDLSEAARMAIAGLVQLGERRGDATALVERVVAVSPDLDDSGQIIQQALRLRSMGV